MNHKRRKPRTNVRCTLCTSARVGNSRANTYGSMSKKIDRVSWEERDRRDLRKSA